VSYREKIAVRRMNRRRTPYRFFSVEDMAVAGQMAVLELLKASRQ
jgi:hypothetical protein